MVTLSAQIGKVGLAARTFNDLRCRKRDKVTDEVRP